MALLMLVAMALALAGCPEDSPSPSPTGNVGTDATFADAGGDATTADTESDATSDVGPETGTPDVQADTAPPAPAPALADPVTFAPFPEYGNVVIQPGGVWNRAGTALGVAFAGRPGTEGEVEIWFGTAAADGQTLAAPVSVSDVGGLQNEPSVCALAGGGYVVVWSRDTQGVGPDGENLEVRFRFVDDAGVPQGSGSTRVLTDRPGNHWLAEVACDDSGGFAVAGVRPDDTTSAFSVFTQRFDSAGQALGQPVDLLDDSDGGQVYPDVDWTADGTTVTAWEDTSNFNTPDEQTVIAMRAQFADGTLGPLVVPFTAPVPLSNAQIATHRASGASIVAGAREGTGVQVALWASPDATSVTPITLPSGGAAPRYAPLLQATPHADAAYLLYFAGTGDAVTPTLVRLSSVDGSVVEGPIELTTAKIPPYPPAMTYANGTLTVMWTESLGNSEFAVETATFGGAPQ